MREERPLKDIKKSFPLFKLDLEFVRQFLNVIKCERYQRMIRLSSEF